MTVGVVKARAAGTSESWVPFARPRQGGWDWLCGRGAVARKAAGSAAGRVMNYGWHSEASVMQMSPSPTFFWLLKGKKSQP